MNYIPTDVTRINIENLSNLNYWAQHFGVSMDIVKSAIARVGDRVYHVADYVNEYIVYCTSVLLPD